MLRQAIPVHHIRDSKIAAGFYGTRLGFIVQFAYRPGETGSDPCYVGISRDDVQIHLSSLSGDGVAGGVVYILVDDIDELHRELLLRQTPIALEPTDQTWGNREMYVKDPDGNSLRFIQPSPKAPGIPDG